jgi:hypothetical protein
MRVELKIGRESNGDDFVIDLSAESNLFISYTEESQLHHSFKNILNQFESSFNPDKTQFAYALSDKTARNILKGISEEFYFAKFIRNEYRSGHIDTKPLFWNALLKEYKRRAQQFKSAAGGNAGSNPILLIFIDDIFDLVLSQTKKEGLSFLEIAFYGAQVGIHFVAASSSTYRNLLLQLIQLNPEMAQKLSKSNSNTFPKTSNPLGCELILSGEGLIFYREKLRPDMIRLYPLEGFDSL